jgi:hypothetical protein
MKNKNKPSSKNLDILISKISAREILAINELICIRGGDGREILPPPPPIIENNR